MKKYKNKVLESCNSYRFIQADIQEIDIKIEELDIGNIEKETIQYEYKEKLLKEKAIKERQLKRINNAISILTDEEKEIIQTVHINLKRYDIVQNKLHLSYQRVKQLEEQAAKKMDKYVCSNEKAI